MNNDEIIKKFRKSIDLRKNENVEENIETEGELINLMDEARDSTLADAIAELEKLRTELKYNYDKQIDLWIKKGNPIEGGQVMRNILEGIDMAISALRQLGSHMR